MIFPLMIGTTEIVALAALALLLFGGKKLPGLMKSMGQGVKQFKEGMNEAPEEFKKGMIEDASSASGEQGKAPENKTLQDSDGANAGE